MTLLLLYMISPLLVAIVFSLLFQHSCKKDKRYLIIMGCIMTFFFCLRSPYIGSGDSKWYCDLWDRLRITPFTAVFSIDLEKGFLLFIWLFSRIFENAQFYFVFTGLLFGISTCVFLKENTDDYVLGFLIFNGFAFFSFYLQGSRQAIGISICLLAVKYCKERRAIPFFALVGLAMLFHASSGVFVVAYFVYGIRIDAKSTLLVMILASAAPYVLQIVAKVANIVMNESYVGGDTTTTYGGTMTMIMYILIILFGLIVHRLKWVSVMRTPFSYDEPKEANQKKEFSFSFFMFLIGAAVFSTRFYYLSVFERGSYFFTLFAIPLLGLAQHNMTYRSRFYFRLVLIMMITMLVIYRSGPSSTVYYYHFFWSD